MMRVRFATVLAFAFLALILPASLVAQEFCPPEKDFGKPRRFAWEFSPFVGANLFDAQHDAEQDLDDHGSGGVRLGFHWTRRWATELTAEFTPDLRTKDRTLQNIDALYLDVNMVFNMNTDPKSSQNFGRWMSSDRWTPYFTFGAGYTSFDFDGADTDEEFTINGGVGTRLMLGRMTGLRFDARARAIPDFDMLEISPSVGFTWLMGGETLRDSDADGVLDNVDRCPDTATGCDADCFGCHGDADGDGVCDGNDRCPDTRAGCYVDAHGCALDSDADGVCDGLDNCPDTPRGCWVDENGCPRDSDNDGVCDGLDQCPDTPEGCRVDGRGCPLDGDKDGVCDGRDECPDTPAGERVDERGCSVLKLVLSNVYFEFNKATIRDFYYPFLDEVSRSLKADNNLYVVLELEGHTDAVGSNRYNYRLAEQRSKAVKEYLVSKGIHPNRLIATTRGETEPVATNSTADGRRRNRRVEMYPRGPEIDPGQIQRYNVVLQEVYFQTNKATIREEYKPFLRDVARVMREARFARVPLVLYGFADAQGQTMANAEQSQQRAQAVKDFLVSQGLSSSRITIRSRGEQGSRGANQEDRRVEVHTR